MHNSSRAQDPGHIRPRILCTVLLERLTAARLLAASSYRTPFSVSPHISHPWHNLHSGRAHLLRKQFEGPEIGQYPSGALRLFDAPLASGCGAQPPQRRRRSRNLEGIFLSFHDSLIFFRHVCNLAIGPSAVLPIRNRSHSSPILLAAENPHPISSTSQPCGLRSHLAGSLALADEELGISSTVVYSRFSCVFIRRYT
jgi:hypothetical protein